MPTSRKTLGAFWLFAGAMHFVIPKSYDAAVPPPLRDLKREITYASGVAEILGGLLVLLPGTTKLGRLWLLLVLAAVYPANIWMAMEPARFGVPRWALVLRLPVQFIFAWHVIAGTRDD
jgi:uncharacterized membrane protein